MQRLPASVIRPKSARVAKVTNVPALSETTTLSSNRKRLRKAVSDDVQELFDVKATDDKPQVASEISYGTGTCRPGFGKEDAASEPR